MGPIGDDDTEVNSDSMDTTQPFNDTIPIDIQTQVVDDSDCDFEENVRTQVLNDEFGDSDDGGGTDRTQVLSDGSNRVSDNEECRGGVDGAVVDGIEGLVVADSETSSDERRDSGAMRRSFMSIRTASLRASGLAAAYKMTSNGTKSDQSSNPIAAQSGKIKEDNQMTALRDREPGKCIRNSNEGGDEVKWSVKSAVRKLFSENSPAGKNGSINDNEGKMDHEFAGLSYVASQEPGDLSQHNALNIVDRLFTVESLPQEVSHEKNVGKKSSPRVSSAKGSRSLALKSNYRSPLGQGEIFDWVDSREDECGGDFFYKQKETIFRSGSHERRSFNHLPRGRHQSKIGKGVVNKLEEKGGALKFRQKIMGLICSDSKLMSCKSEEKGKILEVPETKARKNVSRKLDEQLNPEPLDQQLEANCTDVGIDTQMAAEAIEALVCGHPPNHDIHDAHKVVPNENGHVPKFSKRNKVHEVKSSKETWSTRSISRRKSKNLAVDLGPNDQQHETNCTDAGIGNQMAAEAIKALVYDDPPNHDMHDASKIAPNENERVSRLTTKEKVHEVKSIKESRCTCSTFRRNSKNPTVELGPDEQQHEANCTDVGIGTQMAAEAMEALVYGDPPNHDICNAIVPDGNGRILRLSKGRKLHEAKSSKEMCSTSGKNYKKLTVELGINSAVKAERKKRKSRDKEDQHTGNAPNGCESSDRQSYKSVKQIELVRDFDKTLVKEVDKILSLLNSNGKLALCDVKTQNNDRYYSTPIARRTRRSLSKIALEGSENPKSDSGRDKQDRIEVSIAKKRRRPSSLVVGAPKISISEGKDNILASDQIAGVMKLKSRQQEFPDVNGLREDLASASIEKRDALTRSKEMITNRNTLDHLKEAAKVYDQSSAVDREEAKGQSTTKRKRSKVNVTNVNLDFRRITRSYIDRNPPLSTLEEKSEGTLTRKDVVRPGLANTAVHCSLALMNEKMTRKDLVRANCSTHFGKEIDEDYLKSAKNVDGSARIESSPREKAKLSGSTCVTPVECTTPINAASPVCIGNDYRKQSCRKALSRSPLMRELTRLDATNAVLTLGLKDLRKRRDMTNVRVLFSHHLDEDIIKQQKKILTRLGVPVVCSSSEATHFVTDKFVRTRNMLETIALGKPIVTHLWLESCGQASCLIDEKNYLLRDLKKEKEIGFNMPVSLARACQSPLLKGKRVFITPNIKPGKELIASLVKAVQGQQLAFSASLASNFSYHIPILFRIPSQAVERIGRSVTKDNKIPDDLLVLSCEEDYTICVPLLGKGASVYSAEFLLNGIVIQKLDYESHQLFTDHVKRTRSTIWMRKDGNKFLPVNKCK
ncbi:hypothetical protein GIB67_034466 [Kingdonia uniflora]|uniref:BRCT domain-containing protein n=1 Tax=Kingdonia uniflora TaxID=39325 RepID=A0A7J7PBU7_9MAGN|nr:hypothetical protein GIB67_034466 [Kingdonia uniflora]